MPQEDLCIYSGKSNSTGAKLNFPIIPLSENQISAQTQPGKSQGRRKKVPCIGRVIKDTFKRHTWMQDVMNLSPEALFRPNLGYTVFDLNLDGDLARLQISAEIAAAMDVQAVNGESFGKNTSRQPTSPSDHGSMSSQEYPHYHSRCKSDQSTSRTSAVTRSSGQSSMNTPSL
jgi:hypothetical protein